MPSQHMVRLTTEHAECSNVEKKEEDEGGKTGIKAKHQLLKIAALPGIFLYLLAVLLLIIANIHT